MAEKNKKLYILNSLGTVKSIIDNAFKEDYTVISDEELDSTNANDVVAYIPTTNKQSVSIEELPNLRVVCSSGTGYEHIGVELARSRGIQVGYYPRAFAVETAEFAMTLLLAVTRRLIQGVAIKRGLPHHLSSLSASFSTLHSVPIAGTKLGILGMGSVGFEIAKRAKGFDMSILYHNRKRRTDECDVDAVYYSELDKMLPECDFLVLAARASSDPQVLIGKEQLIRMKHSCILINIARASLIDQDALVTALREKRLGGAGLDVTHPFVLPADHQLMCMENVLVTPHMAWAGRKGIDENLQVLLDNVRAGIEGRQLPYPVP